MENRFGLKDFVLLILVVILIISVWLAIKAHDRQWDQLQTIRDTLHGQQNDLRDIKQRLASGVSIGSATGSSGAATTAPVDENDPFARIRAAEALPNYTKGDWLIDMFPGQVARLTPLLSGDVYAAQVESYVLESLGTRDPDTLEWRPLLAESWETTDNTKDYLAFVEQHSAAGRSADEIAKDPNRPISFRVKFRLRENVRFSDGAPLTVDDVVFTFNFVMNEAINAPRTRAYLSRIKEVRKVGDRDVEFIFAEPYFEALGLAISFSVMPKHFYEQFPTQEFNESVGYLLGSGPYRLENPKSWKPGTPIQLVRNERYWGVQPGFDRMVFREISNDKARQATFRAGEADVFNATPEQYREMIDNPEIMTRAQAFEYQNPIGGYRFVAWNEKNPLFSDKRVRQSLTMLLDRQRMIDEILLGYGVIASGPFNPLSNQFNRDVTPWPFDPERAKSLLREAGCTDRDGDGVLEGPGGQRFEFRLTYPAGSAAYEKTVLYMRDAFARAGIVLKSDPLEWAAFTERLENKNFEAISLGWSSGIETDIYQMFHSSQSGAGGDNFMSYISPELDQVIDKARTTMDEEGRMALWRQAHVIMHEDQPYTFLSFGKSLRFVDTRVHNVKRVRLGLNPDVEWFVPADRQKYTR